MNNLQASHFDPILQYNNNYVTSSVEAEKKESCPPGKEVPYRFHPVITPTNFAETQRKRRKVEKEQREVSIPEAQRIIRSNGNTQINKSINANRGYHQPSLPLYVEFQSKNADPQINDPSFHWAVLPESKDIIAEIPVLNEAEQLFAQGKALEIQGRYSEAFQRFAIAENKGHAEASHCMAIYYQTALDMWIKIAEHAQESGNDIGAFKCYKMAAQYGHEGAQNRLGLYYSLGQGTPDNLPDWENAFTCFQKASTLGHRDAACNLGACYEKGKGVLQSYFNAAQSYRLAGQHKTALFKLALLYKDGKGVEKNDQLSISLLKKSAKIAYNQNDLSHASRCIEIAASLGDLESSTHLGLCYLKNKGFKI